MFLWGFFCCCCYNEKEIKFFLLVSLLSLPFTPRCIKKKNQKKRKKERDGHNSLTPHTTTVPCLNDTPKYMSVWLCQMFWQLKEFWLDVKELVRRKQGFSMLEGDFGFLLMCPRIWRDEWGKSRTTNAHWHWHEERNQNSCTNLYWLRNTNTDVHFGLCVCVHLHCNSAKQQTQINIDFILMGIIWLICFCYLLPFSSGGGGNSMQIYFESWCHSWITQHK